MKLFLRRLGFGTMALAVVLFLSCGGGGGGGSSPKDPQNPGNPGTPTGQGGEGSKSDPVLLTLDQPHAGSIGGLDTLYTSYYYFQTDTAGGYAVSITNTGADMSFQLYSDQYATSVEYCNKQWGAGDELCISTLEASTYYYISVMNTDFSPGTFTITVREISSEGSVATPVALSGGATHAGMVDANAASYYSFTPDASGAYTFAVTDAASDSPVDTYTGLRIEIYAGSDFISGLLRTCNPAYGAVFCTVSHLDAGMPAYVKVSETQGDDTIFDITPSAGVGEGSAANPVVLTVGQGHAGGVGAGSNQYYQGCYNPSYSYYQFATADAGGYTVGTDNTVDGSLRVELYTDFAANPVTTCSGVYQGATDPCMLSNLDGASTYYLRIVNCNDSDVLYTISVTREGSEGSVNSPVPLLLDTPHNGGIGDYGTESYYSFTTDTAGSYAVAFTGVTTGVSFSWNIFTQSDFTQSVYVFPQSSLSGVTPSLDANRTYYLMVRSGATPGGTYTVTLSKGPSEGSKANPVQLTPGTSHSGSVGSGGRSYYTFTTSAAAEYYLGFDNTTDVWVHMYTNPDFTGSLTTACPGPGTNIQCNALNLAAGTAYYVEVAERSNVDAPYTIDIQVLDAAAGCSAGAVECYDFEAGTTDPFVLTSTVTTGNKTASLWKLDGSSNAAAGGGASIRSGTISYGHTTCFEYTRAADTGAVYFSFRTDTSSFNELVFSIDGIAAVNGTFYNTPSWRRVPFFPSAGPHTFTWCFEKGTSTVTGADAVWVDDIEFR